MFTPQKHRGRQLKNVHTHLVNHLHALSSDLRASPADNTTQEETTATPGVDTEKKEETAAKQKDDTDQDEVCAACMRVCMRICVLVCESVHYVCRGAG